MPPLSRRRIAVLFGFITLTISAKLLWPTHSTTPKKPSVETPSSQPKNPLQKTQRLLLFAGAASQPPTTEAAAAYQKKTGVQIDIVFGGSGYVLSQMRLSKQGDLYFPGSSDFMEIAKESGDILPKSERRLAYLVPALNVQRGNPHKIKGLRDLLRPDLRVAIANPEGVCVGLYAVEIIEGAFSKDEKKQLRKNLINYTASCEKTATAISLRQADAVIGWRVFAHWDPMRIESIPLPAHQIRRIGYLPIAIARSSRNPLEAARFMDYLTSAEGRAIFSKHHYFISPEEAFRYLGEKKPIGGQYKLPSGWKDPR